jgi:N-methylhydantoinase A
MGFRIGIDVGGTFTDLVLADDDGQIVTTKVPTSQDLASGLLDGLGCLASEIACDDRALLARTDRIVHGTTVATNAVLTETGARTGLITTRGFRDILAMRRGIREVFYDNKYRAPTPLVPRYLRRVAAERVTAGGEVLTPLDLSDVRDACALFTSEEIEAVAICFMHSYKNPEHERRAAALVRELMPNAFVTASHELLPAIRIYERVSTTVFNAYTGPIVRRYLRKLDSVLRDHGFNGTLLFMQSNGGVTSPQEAMRAPAKLILSGPAAGPAAGAAAAHVLGFKDLAVCDAGGTSFEVSLVQGGTPLVQRQQDVDRRRLALPALGIHTLGAGGGSIAWVDGGGLLHVGPQSAGSDPGPACYGRGGEQATVTDAALMLGYLSPARFLGGRMALQRDKAEAAVGGIATRLSLDLLRASRGIYEVAAANMAAGIHAVTVQRGHDPRDFVMIAGGGAGPLFACRIAEDLQMPAILVPALSATLCAWGMLHANLVHDAVAPVHGHVGALDQGTWRRALRNMREQGDQLLAGENVPSAARQFRAAVDLRYVGQYDDITVPLETDAEWDGVALENVVARFYRLHDDLNGYALPQQECEVSALHVTSIGISEKPQSVPVAAPSEGISPMEHRTIVLGDQKVDVPVFGLGGWGRGEIVRGPCIVELPASTLLVLPDFEAGIDRCGNILVYLASRHEFAAMIAR